MCLLSLQQFEDFGLDKSVLRGIFRAGYVRPTQVQSRVIPLLLKGKSVLVQSKTGTGKTAAFAIPILEWISENSFPHLVLAPTRELAEQVSQEFERLGQVKVTTIIGGVPITPQFSTLKNHIVVGTPGRTLDHVRRGKLKLESFKTVIIDEVDRLLDMGFVEDVEKVIKGAKNASVLGFFSATVTKEVEALVKSYVKSFETIKLEKDEYNVDTIAHYSLNVQHNTKDKLLVNLLKSKNGKALVFTSTKRGCERLGRKLGSEGFRVGWINGDLPQTKREWVLSLFKREKINVLVATDVASRGLDIDSIKLVVNYDVPREPLTYVHRSGRTGRMGKSGMVVSLVLPHERHSISKIENILKRKIQQIKP
ncbi:hypothetical protein B9Q11_05090 [Candidatus Marsarchaeota G2 archaeon ECH_B_SAG-F08]|uniref:RNA helicase n=1 Tax=Candidatus Marsarchaeota G2 archaeon ECH_B_SAG-F08 TaxID=1978165 RepID=A0A2R6BEC8_9ARCH|nr:MAG: hypothetical protein B9Q11_05090 [Candidatus Marsarchaeota G2 archaeon ECH_B_SAG-F08]